MTRTFGVKYHLNARIGLISYWQRQISVWRQKKRCSISGLLRSNPKSYIPKVLRSWSRFEKSSSPHSYITRCCLYLSSCWTTKTFGILRRRSRVWISIQRATSRWRNLFMAFRCSIIKCLVHLKNWEGHPSLYKRDSLRQKVPINLHQLLKSKKI